MSINISVDSTQFTIFHDLIKQKNRLLAPLERQIVMNLLWLESPIHASTMAAWIIREGKKYCRYVLLKLVYRGSWFPS
jgi:hypothetical protein